MENNTNQPPSGAAPAQEAPDDVAVYQDSPQSGAPIKKIISLTIGALVILALIFIFVVFILPKILPKKNENVALTYWGVWEDSVPFETTAQEFTRVHPNIRVTIEKQDIKALGKYYDRLVTRMENRTGPDILRYHNSWTSEMIPLLLPLPQEVVKATNLDSKFYPVVGRNLKVNGAYYGVPIHFDSLSLFVNTEIFKNAGISSYPSTWDDLTSAARQLTVKDERGRITTSGVALGTYDNIAHASDIISLLLIQNGADVNHLDGPAKQSAVDAFNFYTSFAKGDSKVWDDTLENSKLAFASGKVAMYIGYSWDIFEIKAINPNLSFAITPIPHLPTRSSTVASFWAEGVSSATRHPKEAFEFLKFLTSRQNMEKLYSSEAKTRLFGELYPRSDMAPLLKDNNLIYPFVAQGEKAESTLFASDTHDDAMVDSLNIYLGNAVRSILDNNSSSESAIDTLAAGVTQIKGRYAGKTK